MNSRRDDPPGVPFVHGSETSRATAEAKEPTALADEARVLAFILGQGEKGATDHEVSAALGMMLDTARARRICLRDTRHLLMDSGLRRRTPHNRKATVWVAGCDGGSDAGPAKRVIRPSLKILGSAMANIKALVDHARVTGGPAATDDTRALWRWLAWITKAHTQVPLPLPSTEQGVPGGQ